LGSDLFFKGLRNLNPPKDEFNGGGCVLILGGVDFVTLHGKLVREALVRTGRIVKEGGDSLNDGRPGVTRGWS
jgi:hypothetical protein